MTNPTPHGQAPEALPAIQRFEVVDCIDSKHVPAVIPKPHGPWVRYEDHIAALAAGQATAAPENIRGILARCRDFIDTTKAPAYPAGADLADEIDVLLAAQPAPQPSHVAQAVVPAGWKLVPVDATDEMVRATDEVNFENEDTDGTMHNVWHVMIAAAPAQPVAQQLHRSGCTAGTDEACVQRGCGTNCIAVSPQADSVPAVEREQERIAFKDAHRHLDLDEVPDAWGRPMFKHSHVEASWLGWIARAVLAKWGSPQPVVREPLSDAQIAEMMRDTWGCASIAPRHALKFARDVERAHGITQKGGD